MFAPETTVRESTFDGLPSWLTPYTPSPRLAFQGSVAITPDENTGLAVAYWGVIQTVTEDHRGRRLAVEVPQMLDTSTTGQAVFRIAANDEWAQFYQYNGALVTETRVADVFTGTDRPYDPDVHRWWQLREDAAGTVYFEASPNGTDWTELAALPTPGVYANGHIEIAAGYFEAQSAPLGTVRFDNLHQCD